MHTNADPQQFATVATLAQQSKPYALQVRGNAHAPDVRHGDFVKITPTNKTTAPGTLLLIGVQDAPSAPPTRAGIYRINADGDAIAGRDIIEKGRFTVLGAAQRIETA